MEPLDLEEESKVVSEMLVAEKGSEVAEFLRRRPESRLRLRLLNCDKLYSSDPILAVCEAVGGSAVSHASFQSPEVVLWGHDWRNDIFRSVALQTSPALQVLEIDFRLSPENLDHIAVFLDQSHGVQVRIHLRSTFYAGRLQEAKTVLARLAEMRFSEWGDRLLLVQYRSKWLGAVEVEEGLSGTGLSLAPIQQALASARKRELLAKGLEWVKFLVLLPLAVLYFLLVQLEPSAIRRLLGGVRLFWVAATSGDLTRSLQATLRGKRDVSGIVLYSCLTFVPWWVAWFLFKISSSSWCSISCSRCC